MRLYPLVPKSTLLMVQKSGQLIFFNSRLHSAGCFIIPSVNMGLNGLMLISAARNFDGYGWWGFSLMISSQKHHQTIQAKGIGMKELVR